MRLEFFDRSKNGLHNGEPTSGDQAGVRGVQVDGCGDRSAGTAGCPAPGHQDVRQRQEEETDQIQGCLPRPMEVRKKPP